MYEYYLTFKRKNATGRRKLSPIEILLGLTIQETQDNCNKTFKTVRCTSENTALTDKLKQAYKIDDKTRAFVKLINDHYMETDSSSYVRFLIPKAKGGFREINAPIDELKYKQKIIADFLRDKMHILTHDCAFAYTKNRSTLDALKRHQTNEPKWFIKVDLKDFFPNCKEEWMYDQIIKIFPFNFIAEDELGSLAIKKMLRMSCLNGALPQGSPLSPILTNILLVPFDFAMYHTFRNHNRVFYTYTRYADDLLLSCKYDDDIQDALNKVNQIVQQELPNHSINTSKTRVGTSHGRNWNLGLMYNKDGNITVGHKRKERLRLLIFQAMTAFTRNEPWDIMDVQALLGQLAYVESIEPNWTSEMLQKYNAKFNLDVKRTLISLIS